MNADRTKLAVRATVVGYRSARETGEDVGGSRGKEITQGANARAQEILDTIDDEGTDAADERASARRELDDDSRRAFQIQDPSPTPRR